MSPKTKDPTLRYYRQQTGPQKVRARVENLSQSAISRKDHGHRRSLDADMGARIRRLAAEDRTRAEALIAYLHEMVMEGSAERLTEDMDDLWTLLHEKHEAETADEGLENLTTTRALRLRSIDTLHDALEAARSEIIRQYEFITVGQRILTLSADR